MAKMFSGLLCLLVAMAACRAKANDIPTLTGSLSALVAELTGKGYYLDHPDVDPRPYIEPSFAVSTLYRASRHIAGDNIRDAARLARQVDCEVVRFVDQTTSQHYWLLREDRSRLAEPRGWGAYLFHPQSKLPALIEAPHPIDDTNSALVAAQVFARGARGLLIAGAQRDKADVPDLVGSVFHQVHMAWTGAMGQVAVWQIHGFALAKHSFPRGTKAILSTGDGNVVDEMVRLNDQLANRGMDSYSFNRLQSTDSLNQWVNQGTPGLRFMSLAATKNEQGRHLRSIGGTFVHVELEYSVRSNAAKRRVVAEAIAAALRQAASKAPVYPASYTTPLSAKSSPST